MIKKLLVCAAILVCGCNSEYPHRFSIGDTVTIKAADEPLVVTNVFIHSRDIMISDKYGRCNRINEQVLELYKVK